MIVDKSSDLLNYTYKEIVEYLLQKYGPAKYTYFRENRAILLNTSKKL